MTKEELFNNNINIAYKIANKYLINYASEYEDIKQIALLGLWKAALTYDDTYHFSTYAYRIIYNEINMYIRVIKRRSKDISIETIIGDNCTLEDFIKDDEDYIENLLDDIEFHEIKRCLDELEISNTEKEIYESLLEGRKQCFVAVKFGTTQATVSRIQKRINRKIKEKYNRR